MNNFNTVFKTIKGNCVNSVPSKECFDKIETMLSERKSVLSIDFYLGALQDLGLIKYYSEDKLIRLTVKGKATHELFA